MKSGQGEGDHLGGGNGTDLDQVMEGDNMVCFYCLKVSGKKMAKLLDPDGFMARYLVRYVYHNIAPHCHYALPSTAWRPQLSPCSTVLSWPSPTPSIRQALHATYAAGRHCTLLGVTLYVSANLGRQLIAEKDEMRPGALVVRNFVIFAAKHEARVPLCVTPTSKWALHQQKGRTHAASHVLF